ncbi:hypothetical protein MJT46_004498 [Ovis ammon polii x Ovis aries]|nr:hypothetical protein MJT46_004497 [Ovis ammon polii x Ovis aries]KAI4573258.1 hypothetical protein MJT46_004498 [Ovis ammon polii x Ovis aries]
MKGERNSRVVPPFQESPRCVSPLQRNQFSLYCLDVQAEDRVPPCVHVGQPCGPWHRRERNPERPPRNSHGDWPFLRPPERVPEGPVPKFDSQHVHVGQPCGKDSWESLVGKTREKDSREKHRSFDPRSGLRDTAAIALEESASACPHSKRRLTPLGRLQKYPKIHVTTGEESSGSGPESTQGLRPRHQRERNPERPPRNSHGDWPFLRPPERVPEVPVVSREHLPQLEKIQEV